MLQLGTKADTLACLSNKLKYASVLPQYKFTVSDWRAGNVDFDSIMHNLYNNGKNNEIQRIIVRSSALNEDTSQHSQAGKYTSVGDVTNEKTFADAVNRVINSYEDDNELNQVLVQPMLEQVGISGVAFTLDPNTLGNYYVINYDDITGSTESITSGTSEKDKLLYVFKGIHTINNSFISNLCNALEELENLFGQPNLDVEFAMDKYRGGALYILQVRPLCIAKRQVLLEEQEKYLQDISKKIENENRENPFLYGRKTIYGVMPDWNPAEIIGVRPKPLALSLYKEIVTDSIWAYQRDNYGYRNLRSFPLMIDFYGLPYIDVRVSFNSFVPAQLSEKTAQKLVDYYLDKLRRHPDLHDKIEFEIAFTCYTPDLPERMKCLSEYNFSEKEITEIIVSLRDMTNVIIDNEKGLWKKDYKKIQILEKRYEQIVNSNLDTVSKIYWLIEDCKRYGTLPFAGLARAGFIAVQLLRSLVNTGVISEKEYQEFMGELNTVSSIMKKDKQELSKTAFLNKYGHLRPGTYDICSKRYDEAEDIYFDWKSEWEEEINSKCSERTIFKISLKQINKLQMMLKEHGMADDILGFFNFIKTAIEGREYAKFVFTKSLSEAIRLFGKLGKEYNISEEECAYANIDIISKLYASSMNCKDLMMESIAKGKEKYRITKCITLPPLIFEPKDVYCFYCMKVQPNYITLKQTMGEVYEIKSESQEYDLIDKIVIMESADPGYDWIFSHKILGFITKYGGANSHMAIRANELQIPAVIGTGEQLYENIRKAKIIQVDAAGRKVNILR